MAYMQSPGIQVKEYDLTTYVPGVASTEAGIGGVFSWGPVEDIQLVSNENELVQQFGRPTDNNYETFLIASNFLSYSNALYVSRAADANAFNAVASVGTVPKIQILNDADFSVKRSSISSNAVFVASYPGVLGNSLKVSMCNSVNAYTSTFNSSVDVGISISFIRDTFTANLIVTDSVAANTTTATTSINNIISSIQPGNIIKASDIDIGTQMLEVSSISAVTTVSPGVVRATIAFNSRFQLSGNITMTSVTRFWEYYNLVDRAPGTTSYASTRGGTGDELHVIVVDELGEFTGTPGLVLEVWKNLSRITTAVGEQGGSAYYKDVINNSSQYVRAVSDSSTAPSITNPAVVVSVNTLPLTIKLTGGTNSLSESTISLTHLARAYDKFKNEEEVDVSILIAGKTMGGTHGEALANYIIDNIAEVRKDLVVTISPDISDVVNNPYQEAEHIIQFRNALRKSSYAMVSTTYKYQYDRYSDKVRWVAGCGDDAGLIARTDKDRDPWWSPAGHNRGVYKNLIKLAYNPSQADRDVLYRNDVNPSITIKGSGSILYGDKTLYGAPSAFDRINVRRLFITVEKAIKIAARAYLFEFNDEFTRARFRNMVTPYLRDVQGRRGITDFKVICDESNNTGQVIDTNNFIGDIYIKPARSINFITLNFVAVGTSVAFDYVIGKF